MKYFFLTSSNGDPIPVLKDWYKLIDPRYINRANAHRLKDECAIPVQPNAEMFYPDILTSPFFLVSRGVAEVMAFYDTSIKYKMVALYDDKHDSHSIYYLPILYEITCLSNKSTFNLDRSIVQHAILDPSQTQGKAIFKLGDAKNNYFVGRLDFVESILRRDAMGFDLEAIELT